MDSLVLRMQGDLPIHVFPSLRQITTHVVLEQERWFEREWSFIGRWLRPGMRCLDVGANLGVYTLAMARAVGPAGRVWAVEPSATTAGLLRRSLLGTGQEQAVVVECALADRCGTGTLVVDRSPELNRLTAEGGRSAEQVEVSTLDDLDGNLLLGSIDFLKLDAEGSELSILAGASKFLEQHSPLVMFELRHGAEVQAHLIDVLARKGFRLYRLTGPDLALVPVVELSSLDPSELNLFACRDDRAREMQASGHLILPMQRVDAEVPLNHARPRESSTHSVQDDVEGLITLWQRAGDRVSPDRSRVELLPEIHSRLATLQAPHGSLPINTLAWIARFARACALNHLAAQALGIMITRLQSAGAEKHRSWVSTEPAASTADIQEGGHSARLAHAIEAFERCRGFAGCFVKPSTLPLLDWLQRTPFGSVEMERRRQLMALRAGRIRRFEPSPWFDRSENHLNPAMWSHPPESLFQP